jgi:hypothetical protein
MIDVGRGDVRFEQHLFGTKHHILEQICRNLAKFAPR